MMRDQGGERSLYLIPRNVETRFQFFPGFGWFEVGMVVLAFLAGLLFTGFFSLFTEKIFRFVFPVFLPAVAFFVHRPAPDGSTLYLVLKWLRSWLLSRKRYLYRKEG